MQNATASLSSSSTVVASSSAVTAAPVVQNDTLTSGAAGTVGARACIEQLTSERQAWETTAYRTSNDQLYALLQKCYQFYKCMEGKTDAAKALRDGLDDYVGLKGYQFAATSHTLQKVVKCVFSNDTAKDSADRRRVSAYSLVLRVALAQEKTADQIPAFIAEGGGVEAIRLGKSPNALTAKQKADEVRLAGIANSLGVASGLQLATKLDNGKVGKQVVLVGTWQADGTVVVQAVVQSDGVLNAALASYYTASKAAPEAKTKAVEKEAANDATVKLSALDKAVAESKVA